MLETISETAVKRNRYGDGCECIHPRFCIFFCFLPILFQKGGLCLHLPKIISFPSLSRRQMRWFWESFFISILLILFLTGFFYVACGRESGIRQPVLSVNLSTSQAISQAKEKRPNQDSDVFSVSFLGLEWSISDSEFRKIADTASRLYQNYGILIPARYRAPVEALWLFGQLAG